MSKQLKHMMRAELETTFQKVDGGLLLNTQALDSEGQFAFRKAMHQRKLSYTVVKNSIAAQAFKGKGYKIDELNKVFTGPIGILYSEETASAVVSAKALTAWPEWKKIVKDKKIEIKGALLDGAVLNQKQAEQLKSAKGKKELQAELAGVLQAPIQKFAATLQEIYARLAYAVEAVKNKKEGK
jgi:large subunit ribosomal protein L10